MPGRYAANTEVSSDKSKQEIERTLTRYGARRFAYAWDLDANRSIITFEVKDRRYRIVIPMPNPNDDDIRLTPTGMLRSDGSARDAYEQSGKQRWRAAALYIKATLEAVETGITTLEQALLSNMLLADGQTVGEWSKPQLEAIYRTNRMPSLMPGLPESVKRLMSGQE